MEFTVGVITYGRPSLLKRLLESLGDQTQIPDEVIIIDDSEDDESEAIVQRKRSIFEKTKIDFVYQHRQSEGGMPDARNKVIEIASGDVLCFVDDDTVCNPEWLSSIADGYRKYPSAAGVGGPAIDTNESLEPMTSILNSPTNENVITKFGETVDKADRWIPPYPIKTDRFRGANMSFKTLILRDIGGFDTDYKGPALFEDTDLMARLWKRDELLIYHPEARVNHIQNPKKYTRKDDESENWYWEARNSVLFRKKNFQEAFFRSLFRLLFSPAFPPPPPIYKQIYQLIVKGDEKQLRRIQGYIDGLISQRDRAKNLNSK